MIRLIDFVVEQGFAIGNGLTNPEIQYKAYTDYALDMKLIKQADYNRINKLIPACELAIKACGNPSFVYHFVPFTSLFRWLLQLLSEP